jgi:hypothetical protein
MGSRLDHNSIGIKQYMFDSKSMFDQSDSLKAVISRAGGFWAGLTRRERLLLGGLAIVALMLAPISAFNLAQGARETLGLRQIDLIEQSSGRVGTSAAQQRAAKDASTLVAGWGWRAASPAVARVLLEQQIKTLAMTAGLTSIDITVDQSVQKKGPVGLMRAQVNADFSWPTFTDFLRALAKTEKAVMLRSVSVTGDMPVKVQIVLDAVVTLGPPA